MAEASKVEQALDRFEAAMRNMEAAMVRVQEREAAVETAKGEAHALREDRARLTRELDEVRAKASELADANAQASRRIDLAMARVKTVLGS